jgi:hypothetical protein
MILISKKVFTPIHCKNYSQILFQELIENLSEARDSLKLLKDHWAEEYSCIGRGISLIITIISKTIIKIKEGIMAKIETGLEITEITGITGITEIIGITGITEMVDIITIITSTTTIEGHTTRTHTEISTITHPTTDNKVGEATKTMADTEIISQNQLGNFINDHLFLTNINKYIA